MTAINYTATGRPTQFIGSHVPPPPPGAVPIDDEEWSIGRANPFADRWWYERNITDPLPRGYNALQIGTAGTFRTLFGDTPESGNARAMARDFQDIAAYQRDPNDVRTRSRMAQAWAQPGWGNAISVIADEAWANPSGAWRMAPETAPALAMILLGGGSGAALGGSAGAAIGSAGGLIGGPIGAGLGAGTGFTTGLLGGLAAADPGVRALNVVWGNEAPYRPLPYFIGQDGVTRWAAR